MNSVLNLKLVQFKMIEYYFPNTSSPIKGSFGLNYYAKIF